jgi:hypothetical protein
MTPKRHDKRVKRALRRMPLEAIAPEIAASESSGEALWCLVAGEVTLVPADGGHTITQWDDALQFAQYAGWLAAHPERVHDIHESAVAFVRLRAAERGGA